MKWNYVAISGLLLVRLWVSKSFFCLWLCSLLSFEKDFDNIFRGRSQLFNSGRERKKLMAFAPRKVAGRCWSVPLVILSLHPHLFGPFPLVCYQSNPGVLLSLQHYIFLFINGSEWHFIRFWPWKMISAILLEMKWLWMALISLFHRLFLQGLVLS